MTHPELSSSSWLCGHLSGLQIFLFSCLFTCLPRLLGPLELLPAHLPLLVGTESRKEEGSLTPPCAGSLPADRDRPELPHEWTPVLDESHIWGRINLKNKDGELITKPQLISPSTSVDLLLEKNALVKSRGSTARCKTTDPWGAHAQGPASHSGLLKFRRQVSSVSVCTCVGPAGTEFHAGAWEPASHPRFPKAELPRPTASLGACPPRILGRALHPREGPSSWFSQRYPTCHQCLCPKPIPPPVSGLAFQPPSGAGAS